MRLKLVVSFILDHHYPQGLTDLQHRKQDFRDALDQARRAAHASNQKKVLDKAITLLLTDITGITWLVGGWVGRPDDRAGCGVAVAFPSRGVLAAAKNDPYSVLQTRLPSIHGRIS